MKGVFYIVGPTATGKSEIAAAVARHCGGEVVSADAFQIYAGLDLLTAKPGRGLLRAVPHHLVGTIPLTQELNAEQFRVSARAAIEDIQARDKSAFVVGGSGLYLKALTDGLSPLPSGNAGLRAQLDQLTPGELFVRLRRLDPESARKIDSQNKRRLTRAVEICLLSGKPASAQRVTWTSGTNAVGVLLFRNRDELNARINGRVEMMFADGVVEEVRGLGSIGSTAARTLGLHQIQELIAGGLSEADCTASIQLATRRYAKRQLTWFRRQSNFEPLNLSLHDLSDAIEWITRKARLSFAQTNV